ncbi:MAG TPA: septal ring lytic transglycosylase RlpA family protein [Paraburkholderia sp.]|uniref:septal ring lytic transglycosylase RlpA family protein n=1 Tax=Paraburkholderia sp. TaxID=1926495 RepID=UPI002ED285B2
MIFRLIKSSRSFSALLSMTLAALTLAGCAQVDVAPAGANDSMAGMRTLESAAQRPSRSDNRIDESADIARPESTGERPSADGDSAIVPACACNKRFSQTGVASWYGNLFNGRRTASGERYNMHAMTAAHRTLPLGACVRVTALGRARSVVVRINDRGPFTRGRIIDLSYAAAEALGVRAAGSAPVRLEHIAPTRDAGGARRCGDVAA